MSTLTEIREALTSTVKAGIATEVYAYERVGDVVQGPAIVVVPSKADFTGAFARGLDDWDFDVVVIIRRVDTAESQKVLDRFVTGSGPDSVREVLHNNPTLGLDDTDAFAKGVDKYGGEFEIGNAPYLGAIIKVCVRTDGAA